MYNQESLFEAPEERVFGYCDSCGSEIYEGEPYYSIGGKMIHCECLGDFAVSHFAGCLKEAACNEV